MNSPQHAHPAPNQNQNMQNTIPFPGPLQGGAAAPRPPNKLELLVKLEGELATLPSRTAVALHAVNETRILLEFDHAFLFGLKRNGKARIEAVSSLAQAERQAPLIRTLARLVHPHRQAKEPKPVKIDILDDAVPFPFSDGLWLPLLDRKQKAFAGLLVTRVKPWDAPTIAIAGRLASTYALAFRAHTPPALLSAIAPGKWFACSSAAILAALAFVPVPLTTLAPVEAVAEHPMPVTSPLDGVVAEVLVEPNSQVSAGTKLLRFDQTRLQSDEEVAAERVAVAEAKLVTAQSGAFTDEEARRNMPVAERELALAEAEHKNARTMLNKVEVLALKSGIVTFGSRNDLIGKPVQIGEKLMEVADPQKIAYRIDLPVHDAIALTKDARVEVFLDADPLRSHAARMSEMSYHALPQADGTLAYRIMAIPEQRDVAQRLGLRGTARISGETVSLGFYLFRRPIAALRQYLGQ